MGEYREIVSTYRRPLPESWRDSHVPEEVVEVYRRSFPAETVERYSRPLPPSHPEAGRQKPLEMRTVLIPLRQDGQTEADPAETRPDMAERDGPKGRKGRKGRKNRKNRNGPENPHKRRRAGLAVFLLCVGVLVGITVAVRLWEDRQEEDLDRYEFDWTDSGEGREITIPTWPTGQGAALSLVRERGEALTAQEVYRTVNPSVVTVLAGVGGDRMSVGTGVIFTPDGYIVTNYHVVEGGESCTVVLDSGYRCYACYVAGDAAQDLAVLKVSPQDLEDLGGSLPAARFGDSDLLTVGDPVYAIGNPLGWELRGTLTDGIVSAINRDVQVDGRTMTLIQTNAALNSGNSGGPLINDRGQVVGINVIKMSSKYSTVEGLGFAIPSALMERMVNDLLEWGILQPEPLLGVSVLIVAEPLGEGLQGLKVQTVEDGSPADRAGIREGDYILSAQGEPLSASQDLLRVRRRLYLGDEMTLTLWRDGETFDVTLELDQAVE